MVVNELEPSPETTRRVGAELAALRDRVDRLLAANGEFARQSRARETIAAAAVESLATRGNALLFGAGGLAASRVARGGGERRVVAFEFGAGALARAREVCTETNVEWRGGSADGDEIFRRGPYAAAFGVEYLALVAEPEIHLAAILASLAPGAEFRFVTDFYAENTAVHGWRRAFDLPYRLFSHRGWIARFERAGFVGVAASRIRATDADPWRATRGSLVVRGQRPAP